MIETLTYRDRIIELTVVGDTVNDELVLECWDLSPGAGLLFTLVVDHDLEVMLLRPTGQPVPLDLLERVAAIAGTELTAL